MVVVALVLKRSNHLSSIKMLDKVVPLVLIAITLVLESIAPSLGNPVLLCGSSMIAGAFEGLMLILWGESLVRSNAKFSVIHIGATFGCTLFACMVLGLIMPNFGHSDFQRNFSSNFRCTPRDAIRRLRERLCNASP